MATWLRSSRWVPHRPTPKQHLFLACDHVPEILYGGKAGGGKSDALLMRALRYVDVPGYNAILFRRTYPTLTLPGGLIPRSHEWLSGTSAEWNGQTHSWRFPSGAVLAFGSMQYDEDKYNYKGAEFSFIGFEEASEFRGSQMDYLGSRLRRPTTGAIADVPLCIRYASNPGGPGHEWLKKRFVDEPNTEERVFIPAGLEDNPHLGPEYREQLDKIIDPIERARLRDGDWNASSGGAVFDRAWFEIVPSLPAELVNARRVRAWDMAATEGGGCATASSKWCVSPAGVYYVEDLFSGHWNPGNRDQVMLSTARADGPGVEIDWEEEGGSSGKDASRNFTRMLAGFRTHGSRASGAGGGKVIRAGMWASQARIGNVKVVRGAWNQLFLDAVLRFPEAFLDEVDACSVAFSRLAKAPGGFFY